MAAVTICSDLFHGVYEISFSKLIFTKWQLTKIYIYTRNYIVYTFIQKYIYNIHIYKNIQIYKKLHKNLCNFQQGNDRYYDFLFLVQVFVICIPNTVNYLQDIIK